MQHIHLDPLGGIAGDMFAAAMLHAFPRHRDGLTAAVRGQAAVECRLEAHNDGILSGMRFVVEEHDHDQHHHAHAHWMRIRERLELSALPEDVRRHAIGIFSALARAEARIHGVAEEMVTFHEVGAADSIADIVAAAWMIAAIGPASWSISSLPLGSGRIRTAHGIMPVPAPATALLLEGFTTHDDGIPGERVTPTGAAILRYLDCAATTRPSGVLQRSGFGFGSRSLDGISNCLRVLVSAATQPVGSSAHRELAVIAFEIDDQSGEDLATGIEHLRATDGVHDVTQMAAIGKKGRIATHVQVLARPDQLDAVVAACFAQTTTIGLRSQIVQGYALERRMQDVSVGTLPVGVKLVDRPGGTTGKAEADHVRHVGDHAARIAVRRAAEQLAVRQDEDR